MLWFYDIAMLNVTIFTSRESNVFVGICHSVEVGGGGYVHHMHHWIGHMVGWPGICSPATDIWRSSMETCSNLFI